MSKNLHEIYNILPKSDIIKDNDSELTSLTSDSREVVEGSLFICLKGIHSDGHDYIEKAIAQGAKAFIVSKDVVLPDGVGAIKVEDTREAMLLIAPFFYDYPASKMRMIGVTGTNGKTTTTHIIGHILEAQGYKVGIIGTVHVLINGTAYPIHNTTPDAGDLQPILQKMVDEKVEYCVMEVSSHALALNRVAGVEYDTAVFTNLTQDHLDYHKTFENYLAAKSKLFELVSQKNQKKSPKGAVINIDDAYGNRIMEKTDCPVITYSAENNGTLNADSIEMTSKTTRFTLHYNGDNFEVNTKITGLFNVYNTLAAVGACLTEGVSMSAIDMALKSFTSVPGRFELIEEGQSFAVVVDYAHTPDGLENILKTAKALTPNRIIVVFGCGGDRDATKRPIMGGIAATYGDIIFVTSDNPRTEDPNTIVDQVAAGVIAKLGAQGNYKVIVDRKEAIRSAISIAEEGDIILIAGKGHENYQILKDKTIHFDDREIAREALKERV